MKIHFDIDQGSAAWFKLHATIPTASRFDEVMTPGRMEISAARKKYACQIISSRLLNWQPSSLDTIKHIEEGKLNEPFAVSQLELIREVETRKVGFITTNDQSIGASPDRVVMSGNAVQITVECKAPTIPVQMEYLLAEKLADMEPKSRSAEAYKCQRQGQLYVAEAEEAIFYSYQNRMPACYARNYRDEPFIKKLADCLSRFNEELEELTEEAKRLGTFDAFADMATPIEAEHGDNLRRGHDTVEKLAEILEGETGNKLSWGA